MMTAASFRHNLGHSQGVGTLGSRIAVIGPASIGARVAHALYAWISNLCQKDYVRVARG